MRPIPWPKFFSGVSVDVCPVCGLKYETEIGLKTRCRHAEPEVIPEQGGEEFHRKTKNVFKYLQLLFPGTSGFVRAWVFRLVDPLRFQFWAEE